MKCAKLSLLVLGLGLSTALLLGPVRGDDKKDDKKEANRASAKEAKNPDAKAELAAQLVTAHQLIRLGRDKKSPDPLALVVAARILGTTPTSETKMKEEEGKDTKEAKEAKEPTAKELLDEAAGMTKDEHVVALIKATRKQLDEHKRGDITGPATKFRYIGAGQTVVWTGIFRGQEFATCSVSGEESGLRMSMTTYDDRGIYITSSGPGTSATCSWTPIYTGTFKFYVRNHSGFGGQYVWINN